MALSNNKNLDKIFNILEFVFLCLFGIYVALGNNNITYGTKIISLVMWPSLSLGLLIVLYRFLNYKKFIKMPGLIGILGLLFSIGISTLLNYKYSFKENIVLCIYWVLFFLVLYLTDNEASIEKTVQKLKTIGLVYVLYSLLCSITSIFMMFSGISEKIIANDGYEYYKGFSIGRLWGVFINPNNGAITCALASAILVFFIITTKKMLWKIVFGVLIIPEILFIALSDSRSGAVCFGVVFAVFVFAITLYKIQDHNIYIKISAIIASLLIAVVGFYIPRQTKTIYNSISVSINNASNNSVASSEATQSNTSTTPSQSIESNTSSDTTSSTPPKKPINVVDRGYDLTGDISNRRFDVWKGAIRLFADSPKSILFGYSFKGFTEQALILQPNNYIVNNTYAVLKTTDNEFFNILVAQGILGILFFLWLIVSVIILIFRKLLKVNEKNIYILALGIAVCFALAVSAMFCSVMFYHISQNCILFWCFLGGLVHILKKSTGVKSYER